MAREPKFGHPEYIIYNNIKWQQIIIKNPIAIAKIVLLLLVLLLHKCSIALNSNKKTIAVNNK